MIKICKWLIDDQGENFVNSAYVNHISFVDKGPDCPNRYRIMAITDNYDFVLYEHDDEKKVKARFWVYFGQLNMMDARNEPELAKLQGGGDDV